VLAEPFGGSGTTLLAAERTGRIARLIELDPSYVDVTIRRCCTKAASRRAIRDPGSPSMKSRKSAAFRIPARTAKPSAAPVKRRRDE
jgi:DNA modification methylase